MGQSNLKISSVVIRFKRFSRKRFGAFLSMHRVINIGVLVGITLGAITVYDTEAQQRRPQRQKLAEEDTELQEVTVTASKVSAPLNSVARQVTVITQREISSAPIHSLHDLLVYSAGVDVQQRGGHGVQADISIRGGSFDQNAILLNGINISNAQTGHLSYDIPVNTSDIERIEIIHGASALIYGSSAFSGGINIITKKAAHDKLYAQILYGHHHTYAAQARVSFKNDYATHSISVGHRGSKGHTENTDYKQLNILAQSNLNLDRDNSIQLQLGYNDKAYGANAFYSARYPGQYDETSNLLLSAKGEFGSKRLRIIPIVYWNNAYDRYLLFRDNPSRYENKHNSSNYGANLIFSYTSALGTTSLGAELRQENIRSNRLGLPMSVPEQTYTHSAKRTNTSFSLEHSFSWRALYASLGVLINNNTQRSTHYEFLPSISLTYRPSKVWSASASWSRATRMPTYIDLYYSSPVQVGDNQLKPEQSESLEVSLKYRKGSIETYLTGFSLWGKNMIDWAKPNPSETVYRSMNIGILRTMGIELGARLRLAHLLPWLGENSLLQIDYARMTQNHDAQGYLSMYVQRYLRDKLSARLSIEPMKKLSMSWYLRYQKRMGTFESGVAPITGAKVYSPYPAFMTLDTQIAYELLPTLRFNLLLNNITNTRYFDFASVIQPGFNASLGVTLRLKR